MPCGALCLGSHNPEGWVWQGDFKFEASFDYIATNKGRKKKQRTGKL